MIVIAAIILGAVYGVYAASRKGGNRLDKAQYGAVFAIIFALVGLFLTVAIEKLM
ncbi:MAG: hypothetical protein KUG58_09515 [Marinosulfonomonas sp.]|nr:hypothetical protein [Marinosulfonomonas sp.]